MKTSLPSRSEPRPRLWIGVFWTTKINWLPISRVGISQPLFDFGNFYGEGWVEGGVGLGGWGLGALTNDRKLAEFGRDATEALLDSTVVVTGLKYAVGRERPDGSNNQSFPSGHSITAFCFAPVVIRLLGLGSGGASLFIGGGHGAGPGGGVSPLPVGCTGGGDPGYCHRQRGGLRAQGCFPIRWAGSVEPGLEIQLTSSSLSSSFSTSAIKGSMIPRLKSKRIPADLKISGRV